MVVVGGSMRRKMWQTVGSPGSSDREGMVRRISRIRERIRERMLLYVVELRAWASVAVAQQAGIGLLGVKQSGIYYIVRTATWVVSYVHGSIVCGIVGSMYDYIVCCRDAGVAVMDATGEWQDGV